MRINCEQIASGIKNEVMEAIEMHGIKPVLGLVRILGDDASGVYVRNKVKACEEVGIKSVVYEYPNNITEEVFLTEVKRINKLDDVTGIIVQLPLPKHINKERVLQMIDPYKDVDCLGNTQLGHLFSEWEDMLTPCTPEGIMSIVKNTVETIRGKRVLIINRSMLVGKPLVELMQREDATVTLAHSKTSKDSLDAYMLLADIIVTGVGKADFINSETLDGYMPMRKLMQYPNQIFIDVSMNRDKDGKLCGDVSKDLYDREDIQVTPVPKGVGLTTVASLLKNVTKLEIAKKYNNM